MKEEQLNILIQKYLNGQCSPLEKQELEQWLEENDQNRRHFEQIAFIEQELKQADFGLEPDTAGEWAKLRSVIVSEEHIAVSSTKDLSIAFYAHFGRFWKVAAAMIVTAGIAWLVASQFLKDESNVLAQIIEVPKGETQQLSLPDGSIVQINADSKLTIEPHYNESERRVSLRGEAYFEVAKDPHKPFIVETGELNILVLGTSFNVDAYPESHQITVAVAEGRVHFSKEPGTGLILEANTSGRYDLKANTFEQNELDAQTAMDWLDDRLVFDDIPLSEIFLALERKFGLTINNQSELTDQLFSDNLEKDDTLETILDHLSLTFGINYEVAQGIVTITSK